MALAQVAARQPDAPAILWPGGSLDYRGFEDRASRIAGALRARIEGAGRVAIVMENGPEFLPVLFGIWRAGLTAIPVNARLHPREHAWILDNAEAALCIASPALAEAMERRRAVPGAERAGRGLGRAAGRGAGRRGRQRAGRAGLDLLHLGHDRAAEGRGADISATCWR